MSETIEQLVSELAEARRNKAQASNAVAEIKDQYKAQFDALTNAKDAEEQAYAAVIAAGGDAEHPALEIKNMQIVTFVHNDEQLKTWCMKWMAVALVPDKKLLESAAKKGFPFPPGVVNIIKEPKVTVKSNLSAYLPKPASKDLSLKEAKAMFTSKQEIVTDTVVDAAQPEENDHE